MKVFSVSQALLLLVLVIINSNCAEEEEGVIVLNDTNFEEEIKNFNFLIIEFYAPWCGHCKSLAPEYAKAAKILSELEHPIRLAKVDATVNTELSKRFEIEGYPTIKFYKNGQYGNFESGRSAEEIVKLAKKKGGMINIELKTVNEVEEMIKKHNVTIISFTPKDKINETQTINEVAAQYDEINSITFAHCISQECVDHYKPPLGNVILFKNFDDPRVNLQVELTEASLKELIDTNSIPIAGMLNEQSADFVFLKNKATLYYIRSEDNAEHVQFDQIIKEVGNKSKFRGKLYFIIAGTKGDLEERLLEYFDIKPDSLPQVIICDVKGDDDIKHYAMEEKPINKKLVKKFAKDFLKGILSPVMKSDPVPTEQNGPVHVIVGKTFQQDIIENPKSVFVKYYAPWCGHCKKLAPIWEKIGEKYQNHPEILIAQMDATTNEAEGLSVSGYPTIKLYHAKDKKHPIDYEGEREFEAIDAFIKEQLGLKSEEPKEEKEEKSEL